MLVRLRACTCVQGRVHAREGVIVRVAVHVRLVCERAYGAHVNPKTSWAAWRENQEDRHDMRCGRVTDVGGWRGS